MRLYFMMPLLSKSILITSKTRVQDHLGFGRENQYINPTDPVDGFVARSKRAETRYDEERDKTGRVVPPPQPHDPNYQHLDPSGVFCGRTLLRYEV